MSRVPEDDQFMQRALALAKRGQGRVEPNPMVGAVLVRNGQIIAEGWHRRFGGPHAEVEVFKRCTTTPAGATLYVSLEPCCYHGKTPPCTEAVIAAGVARVVVAMVDPNPRVAGQGLEILRRAGVKVDAGVCEEAAQALNAPFTKLIRTQKPWIIAKWAQSIDGKIATHTGDAKWISDETCRAHAHRTRGRLDGIIVGVGTVLSDDPLLTCRVGRPKRVATRIVLDPHLRTPRDAQLIQTAPQTPTLLFCASEASRENRQALVNAGCEVVPVDCDASGLPLDSILRLLYERKMTNVLVEGGGQTLGQFFERQFVDEVHCYIAPRLIGGRDAPGPWHTHGAARVAEALHFADGAPMLRRMGGGWFLSGYLR